MPEAMSTTQRMSANATIPVGVAPDSAKSDVGFRCVLNQSEPLFAMSDPRQE